MPKKKQVTFQRNVPGKYIPRDDTPSPSAYRSGTNANRFNSKMVELLASSSPSSTTTTTVNNENEPISNTTKSSQDEPIVSISSERPIIDSSHVHSKVLRRRIVTMLETLRRRGGNGGTTSPSTSPKLTSSNMGSKSQPITFGQLRQATTTLSASPPSSSSVGEEVSSPKITSARSYTDLMSINASNRQSYHTSLMHSDLIPTTTMPMSRSSPKHSTNPERLFYSPSLEQLLEHHTIAPRKNEQNEPQQEEEQQPPKSPLTVDEILATYYSKVKVPTATETNSSSQPSSYLNSNMGFYIHPSTSGWHSPQTNPYQNHPPQLLLNEQNRNRPPPPSYSFSIASGHRPPPTPNNLAQHLIRPPVPSSIREHAYSGPQIPQHLLPGNSPVTHLPSPPIRPLPSNYESPSSNIERSHSELSSMSRPNHTPTTPPQAGFDHEFSRLLYGKEDGKNRHQRQKRKAFSDPVKKSVEEAGRSVEKTHRRLTTHLNKTDTVKEEEENTSDSNEIDKQEQKSFPQRHFPRQTNENNRETAKKAIVPANPLLKRRIPSFLRVYSQASSSNDILLQWHLFSFSDLESFDAMMKKLYKDENLARVQRYENYRALLYSTLASKTSINNKKQNNNDDDDDNGITTTAL